MRRMRRGVSERSRDVQGPPLGGLPKLAACVLVLALSGCANGVGSYDPVAWWHHLEGGQIAQNRPQPPGINAPYPSLATIPSRPEALSARARAEAASSLLQDQENGAYALAQPVAAPPPAPAAPPAPGTEATGARMAAVGSQPGAAAATTPAPAQGSAPVAEAVGDASLSIPAGPPPPPNLPGVPWLTQASPLPQAPAIPPAPPPAGTGGPVAVAFARASAVLSPDDEAALRRLAVARAASVVAVTGFGEALGNDPAIQVAALRLAWARAAAIAAVLRRDGVPDSAMTVTAYGPGGGGVARLVPAG